MDANFISFTISAYFVIGFVVAMILLDLLHRADDAAAWAAIVLFWPIFILKYLVLGLFAVGRAALVLLFER